MLVIDQAAAPLDNIQELLKWTKGDEVVGLEHILIIRRLNRV
jgi:hypothetical protein